MPIKNDYSEWLSVDNRLEVEEKLWAETCNNTLMANIVKEVCKKYPYITTIQEFGCGTGWIPSYLPLELDYCGLDKNPGCLELARAKNPTREFVHFDVRHFVPEQVDLVITLSFLKHFELEEWDALFNKIITSGTHACFSMSIDATNNDDGVDFPHSWITMEHIEDQIKNAGHHIENVHCFWEEGTRKECIFTTKLNT